MSRPFRDSRRRPSGPPVRLEHHRRRASRTVAHLRDEPGNGRSRRVKAFPPAGGYLAGVRDGELAPSGYLWRSRRLPTWGSRCYNLRAVQAVSGDCAEPRAGGPGPGHRSDATAPEDAESGETSCRVNGARDPEGRQSMGFGVSQAREIPGSPGRVSLPPLPETFPSVCRNFRPDRSKAQPWLVRAAGRFTTSSRDATQEDGSRLECHSPLRTRVGLRSPTRGQYAAPGFRGRGPDTDVLSTRRLLKRGR